MKLGLRHCGKEMNKRRDWNNIWKLTLSGSLIDQVRKMKTGRMQQPLTKMGKCCKETQRKEPPVG